MSKSPKQPGETPVPPTDTPISIILAAGFSTTMRMFVPTIGFTLLGAALDAEFATKPLYTLIGAAVGFILAALLIYRQLTQD
ncbi:AtpZ/AtpI family protein [Candidatus Saccharibacteria bacterium]|nr:AtpZ/AtpI family protein [Candidatus Saccharibacteria bacterium]